MASAWSGTHRRTPLSVPVHSYRTYSRSACSADCNLDGFLEFSDYDLYVGCFEAGAWAPGTLLTNVRLS